MAQDDGVELLEPVREGYPRVDVALGFTKNIGSYENLKVYIGWGDLVESGETHEEATERVYSKLEAELVRRVNQINDELGPKRSAESGIHARK